MADGFAMGGGTVQAGTIYIEVKTAVQDAVKELRQLEQQANKTAKKAGGDMKAFGEEVKRLLPVLTSATVAYTALREAQQGFISALANDRTLREARAVMRGFGYDTQENVEALKQLAVSLEETAAVAEQDTYATFKHLLGVTRDYNEALRLTILLQRTQILYGKEIAASFVGALGTGELGRLPRQLARAGIRLEEETLTGVIEALTKATRDLDIVLQGHTVRLEQVRAQWRNFTEDLTVEFAPAIIDALKGMMTAFWTLTTILTTLIRLLPPVTALFNIFSKSRGISGTMADIRGYWDYWRYKMGQLWGKSELPTLSDIEQRMSEIEMLMSELENELTKQEQKTRKKGEGEEPSVDRQRREFLWEWNKQEAERLRREAEAENEILRRNWELMKKYQEELRTWDIRNSPLYLGLTQLADLFGDTLVRAMMDFKFSFEDLGRSLRQILAEIIRHLLMMKVIYPWMERTLGLPAGYYTGQPQKPQLQGFGGARPLSAGGVTVQIQGTSGGMLMSVWKGATLTERKAVSSALLTTGGKVLTLTA